MTAAQKDARIAHLEMQRQKYFRQMWRAHEVLREIDPARAAELVQEWDTSPVRGESKETK